MSSKKYDHASHSCGSGCDDLQGRINVLCDLAGSAAELARLANVSAGVIRKWRDGVSEPTASKLLALANAVDVSIAWLLTGRGAMRTAELSDHEQRREDIFLAESGDQDAQQRTEQRLKAIGGGIRQSAEAAKHAKEQGLGDEDVELVRTVAFAIPDDTDFLAALTQRLALDAEAAELSQEYALIPGYSVQVAAGAGAFPIDEQPTRRLAFRRKWLRFRGLNEKDLVLVFAKGDSMEPTISDNNTVMIDTSQRELTDGAIYVIRTDHHLIVKRVQTLLGNAVLLLSDNQAYQPIEVKMSEVQDLEVIGRVVWIGKDV